VDGWLDALAGAGLDDTRVGGLVIYRYQGELLGTALGYNKKGEPRSGTLQFAQDKLLYPNPPDLKAVARQLRRTMEFYAPSLREKLRRW
jgi:hypothetical protein